MFYPFILHSFQIKYNYILFPYPLFYLLPLIENKHSLLNTRQRCSPNLAEVKESFSRSEAFAFKIGYNLLKTESNISDLNSDRMNDPLPERYSLTTFATPPPPVLCSIPLVSIYIKIKIDALIVHHYDRLIIENDYHY